MSSYGYDVTTVDKDGSQVLIKVKLDCPDILIMDAFMPHVDALGVMSSLKDLKLKKRPMIVVLSGVDNPRFEKEILSAGADYYFLKPFDPDVMAQRLLQQFIISRPHYSCVFKFYSPKISLLSLSKHLTFFPKYSVWKMSFLSCSSVL